MTNKKQKNIKIQSSKYMNSLFVGNFKASFAGKGIEFQDFREYTPGDDAKYIDWARSSMESSMIMRRYKEEKNTDIYCYLDMRESLYFQDSVKLELLYDVTDFLYHAAAASSEKFGGFIDSPAGVSYIRPSRNPSSLHILNNYMGQHHSITSDLDLKSLMNPKLKRSIIFVISDSMNIDEKSFKAASKKHDIIYIHLSSNFEDTLSLEGLSSLRSAGVSITIDTSSQEKRNEYIELKQEQKRIFAKKIKGWGSDTLFLNESSSLPGEFLALMKKRMNIPR